MSMESDLENGVTADSRGEGKRMTPSQLRVRGRINKAKGRLATPPSGSRGPANRRPATEYGRGEKGMPERKKMIPSEMRASARKSSYKSGIRP